MLTSAVWEVSEVLRLLGLPPPPCYRPFCGLKHPCHQYQATTEEQRCKDSSRFTLPLPGFNCAHKGRPEASEASLRQSQRQGDFRLWPQSSLCSPPLCPAAAAVSEPAGVLHISYMQQSGGTMEQIMNKLGAELWNSSLCEPPSLSAGTAGLRGTQG